MENCIEQAVEIHGLNYVYKLWGDADGLPVIALHGWLDNAASFDLLAPLMKGCQVVALDMAGHGLSGHRNPQAHYNLWDDLLDILAIADHLGWRQFTLLGHSRGALISVLLAGSMPERISSLLMLDGVWPLPVTPQEAPQQLRQFLTDNKKVDRKKLPGYTTQEQAIKARCKSSGLSESAAKLLITRGLEQTSKGYQWRSDSKLTTASAFKLSVEHSEAFLAALSMPVFLCLASKGFGAYPELNEHLAKYPQFHVHRIEGSHHFHMEEPVSQIATLINAFLAAGKTEIT